MFIFLLVALHLTWTVVGKPCVDTKLCPGIVKIWSVIAWYYTNAILVWKHWA